MFRQSIRGETNLPSTDSQENPEDDQDPSMFEMLLLQTNPKWSFEFLAIWDTMIFFVTYAPQNCKFTIFYLETSNRFATNSIILGKNITSSIHFFIRKKAHTEINSNQTPIREDILKKKTGLKVEPQHHKNLETQKSHVGKIPSHILT